MKKWNRKNALRIVAYAILYAALTAVVCVTGAIHPVLFVCYQITAGLLLTGVIITAYNKVKAPGVALCLGCAMIFLFIIINDAAPWHVIPIVLIMLVAEAIRFITKYNWMGDVIGTVIMSFSSFGYYGQIWFNRDYTYECSIEEMPSGYADSLMSASPAWALVVVLIVGIIISVIMSNVTAKIFKLER